MGYFKNLEIEGQVEEPDRVVADERRRRRRATYERNRTITVASGEWRLLMTMTVVGWLAVFGLSVWLAVTL